jgi:exopolyphosphatase/pppGpp-phosphohydrolase
MEVEAPSYIRGRSLAAAVVVEEVMTRADTSALTVCKNGVRDGILLREALRSNGAATPGFAFPFSAATSTGLRLRSGRNGSIKFRQTVQGSLP